MKTILVPTDFSKTSEYACKIAAKIAKKTNATIYLIHLIELPKGVIDMAASSKFSIPESMLYLRKIREKILNFRETLFSKDINVEYFIKINNPFDGIQKYADKIFAILFYNNYRSFRTSYYFFCIRSNNHFFKFRMTFKTHYY